MRAWRLIGISWAIAAAVIGIGMCARSLGAAVFKSFLQGLFPFSLAVLFVVAFLYLMSLLEK